jgi:hypothetical protein
MKKLLSVFLCIMMVITFSGPVKTKAANQVINYLSISKVGLPKDGLVCGSTFRNPEIKTNPVNGVTIDNIEWYDETSKKLLTPTDAFEGGHVYTVHYYVSANSNFEFKVNDQGAISFSPTITLAQGLGGGGKFEISPYDETSNYKNKMKLSYTLPPVSTVPSISVNLDLPVLGETPDYTVAWVGMVTPCKDFDRDDKNGTIKDGVFWTDMTTSKQMKSTDKFVKDHVYAVQVIFNANTDYFFAVDSQGKQSVDEIKFNAVSDGDVFSSTLGLDAKKQIVVGAIMELHTHVPLFWVTTKEPKCEKAGEEQIQCSTCRRIIETRTIAALGHDYENTVIKEATYDEEGKMFCKCKRCGISKTVAIPRLKYDISGYTVNGIKDKTYTGSALTQAITVEKDGKKATFSAKYSNNINVGTATVTLTGNGDFKGTITKTFKILKAKQKMKASAKTKTVKLAKAINANQKVKKAIKVKKAKGKVTFKKVKKGSASGLKISKSGVITVAKNSAYKKNQILKIKVKVTAKGDKNYKSASKTVTVKIKLK